ncbi:MAG: chromosome segregation SMC family protein [Candidatus Pacearchaeota archaeon]
MYIKKLVIHGFKSFPKKTEIPFTKGINVILGPNGSGKSNISDAICFVLGRLSTKSMRATKAENLIFLGTKDIPHAKEASVEIVFDNSDRVFSLDSDEVVIKRIVRRNGQSIYKIGDETKTRQEILSLLAQAGIDPQGFNIILQGEIQSFVRMQSEERRKIIEEVAGISVYESRKEKSLHELEKTEEKLKEIASILRERTAYLKNLERERQEALKFKKLEEESKKIKASIISYDLHKKKKESDGINQDIENKIKEIEKIKKIIISLETEIKNFQSKIEKINLDIQKSTGFQQEKINEEIANLRIEISSLNVKAENKEAKILELSKNKEEIKNAIKKIEAEIKEIESEEPTLDKKEIKIDKLKKELELLDSKRKKFYMIKSGIPSLRDRIQDKTNLIQNYNNELDILIRQIESISAEISDQKADKTKLEKLKNLLTEKKNLINNLLRKEIELEKSNSFNESEIENQKKIIEKISKMDICPVCKSKITPQHIDEIKNEILPYIDSLKKQIDSSNHQLKTIYQKKEILTKEIEDLNEQISKLEKDIEKIFIVNDKKNQLKIITEKIEETKKELDELDSKRKKFEKMVEADVGIEKKYETLRIEIQELALRSKETLKSEAEFKKRELERFNISIKQIINDEKDTQEEFSSLKRLIEEKTKTLELKKKQEEELSGKFKTLIKERDALYTKVREKETEILKKKHEINIIEIEINDLKILKARIDAEAENLEAEMMEFKDIEVIKTNREVLVERLEIIQQKLSQIGVVNLRSLEVYDSIKKEYDSVKEKADKIEKEKESILKIIHEIDIKKKRTFLETMKKLNELFSRNFRQLSPKAEVLLEIDNPKEPFEEGSGVQIIVKMGHGKYFDVKSLSGGEQTLVALSLIFAIQEYKPYYFYLLDEIDAALDKRNSERLASLLDKYMLNGQYIIITHNDEIISRATNLYGISMYEGISKIISLKV